MTPIFDEIRATDLEDWARRAESERWMPSLLRQLALGSGAKLRQCRFLTHEQTNLGGWDGIIEAETQGLYVPLGFSGWELSRKGKDRVVEKAREDAEERTLQPGDLIPADTTLIIVTLRIWPRSRRDAGSYVESHEHKAVWTREQADTLGWREVQVLDAVDIAGWIAQQPGVGIWLAHVMGRNVRGAQSLVLHWQDLETLHQKLSPSVFLAGRGEFSSGLDAWFSAPSVQALDVQSWSHEDVRDAVAAWWRNRDNAETLSAISPLAVTTLEAWQYLTRVHTPLLLLADGGLELTPEQVSAAIAHGHRVILRTNAGHSRDLGCRLAPLHRDSLAEELKKCGIDYNHAWRMAGEAGGSGVVLKRMLAGHGAEPEWAENSVAAKLAPIVLFGAWDANCDADKTRIGEVFGQSYDEVETLLQPWATANHPLLRHVERNWRVISREDAWRWLSPHLRAEHYTRFRQAAVTVLAELNPRYDMPVDQRIFASIHKKEPQHSYRLRRAMAETLCLLGLRSPDTDAGARAVGLVRGIAGEIFAKADDWRLWASLDYALLFIAEATPDLFLKAVEDDLRRDSPATLQLFRQSGDNTFGDHPHVEVMWALEGLMWERAWVTHATLVLGRMAALDPGGNCSPRPMGVLREAFLPWFPQCCLEVEDRCRLLDKIMEAEPDVAWDMFFGLLPKTHDMSSPRHRPTYRKITAVGDEGVTHKEYWQQVSHVARRLVEMAGTNSRRWQKVIEELDTLPDEIFSVTLAQVEALGLSVDDEKRIELWEALRREAAKHRYYATAEWAMPEEKVAKVEAVVAKLEPDDPVARRAWIFTRREAHMPGTNCDTPIKEQEELRTAAQVVVLREIAAVGGLPAIRALVIRSEFQSGQIGFLVAKHGIINADAGILPHWLEDESDRVSAFARGYASARFADGGWDWLRQIEVGKWSPKTFAGLAWIFPLREETWKQIDGLGAEYSDAFWRVAGTWMHGASTAETERVIRELIAHQRAFAALECADSCAYADIVIPNDLSLAVLDAVRAELCAIDKTATANSDQPKFEGHHIGKVLLTLQQSDNLTPEQAERVEQFEWFFLPILKHYGSPRTLLRRLRREPEFFVEALVLSRHRRDQPEPANQGELSEHDRNLAEQFHQLLDSVHLLPGTNDEGRLDEQVFRRWIKEARELAAAKGYTRACEYIRGMWMLYSPVDEDGSWPCAAVCRLMTDDGSDKMKDSFEMAIFNNQGWPGPMGNGLMMSSLDERRQAMLKLRESADKLDLEFPVVAAILRSAAKSQEHSLNERLRDDD
jgi:hypothetical protein